MPNLVDHQFYKGLALSMRRNRHLVHFFIRFCGACLETEDSLNKGTAVGSGKKTAYLEL